MTKWRERLAQWMVRTAIKVDGRPGVGTSISYRGNPKDWSRRPTKR